MLRLATTILVMVLSSVLARAEEESTWDAYVPGSMNAVISQHEADASRTDHYFTSDNFPSRVKVTFLGKKRSLPKERALFLDKYFKTTGQPEFRKLFKSEVLVKEGAREHWLPIQTDILPSFVEEVRPQTEVEVFVTWFGATRVAGKLEWVFSINEFQAIEVK